MRVDKSLFRPGEVPYLRGDYYKLNKAIGWKPTTSWITLLQEMIDFDIGLLQAPDKASQNALILQVLIHQPKL